MKKYHPGEPVNIHTESLINIIQEKNRAIKTKKGKGKLPLFFVNGEQVITIYGGSSVFLWGTTRPKRDGLRRRWNLGRGVKRLLVFSILYPQMTYDGLKILLYQEWKFLQCATPSDGSLFAPLKTELGDDFSRNC